VLHKRVRDLYLKVEHKIVSMLTIFQGKERKRQLTWRVCGAASPRKKAFWVTALCTLHALGEL